MIHKEMIFCITGAAGQIAYSLLPQLCRGLCFPGVSLHIRLLDITNSLNILKGVILQLQDCSFPLVKSVLFGLQKISYGDKAEQQFKDADIIVFLGGFPRKPGMQRKDLLQINKKIFVEQAKALSVAKKDVRCLVVANPANTNAYILSHYSPNTNPRNITCLSRLDHNRALGQITSKTGVKGEEIQGVYIFGNHSLTQYPSINQITVQGKSINEYAERQWLQNKFIPTVQKRGGEVLQARGGSSVFSAASAVVDHLRDWYLGSDKILSMGVRSQGDYGIPEGLWSSFPVRCKNFTYQIVKSLPLSQFCQSRISISIKQLQQQIQLADLSQ